MQPVLKFLFPRSYILQQQNKTQRKNNLYAVNGLKLNKKVKNRRKAQIDQILACASNYNLQTSSSIIISVLNSNPALKKFSSVQHQMQAGKDQCKLLQKNLLSPT